MAQVTYSVDITFEEGADNADHLLEALQSVLMPGPNDDEAVKFLKSIITEVDL